MGNSYIKKKKLIDKKNFHKIDDINNVKIDDINNDKIDDINNVKIDDINNVKIDRDVILFRNYDDVELIKEIGQKNKMKILNEKKT